ncbi:MAG: sigma-70 family RNA polymerase sigma factor [Acidobacteriia bacterium]|nr:sigma-70 family RNA polymerase sigma factor [Terriglobia bacterium]
MSIERTAPAILPVSTAGPSRDTRLEAEVVDLFDQFRDRLLRYLLAFGLAIPDAEEIIQEVFLSLFRHLQRGKSRANLRAWLFRVAHNQALKRRQRNRRDPESLAADGIAVDPTPNPEDQALSTQTHRRLLAVVRALPEQDRRCLALRTEGLRYREIAGVLDMSLGAVSISIARSLARLTRATER